MSNLQIKNLFWSTRGREWGFRMLLLPQFEDEVTKDWISLHQKLFSQLIPGEDKVRHGQEGKFFYGALILPDPEQRRDESGRLIPHEIAFFSDKEVDLDNFKNRIWTQISEVYENLYSMTIEEIQNKEISTTENNELEIRKKTKIEQATRTPPNSDFLAMGAMAVIVILIVLMLIIQVILPAQREQQAPPTQSIKEKINQLEQCEDLQNFLKLDEAQSEDSLKAQQLFLKNCQDTVVDSSTISKMNYTVRNGKILKK